MKNFFKTSNNYLGDINSYSIRDFFCAISLYIFYMAYLVVFGFVMIKTSVNYGMYFNIIFIPIVYILTKLNKQTLSSLGINKENLAKSVLTGLIIGIIYFAFSIIIPLANGAKFKNAESILITIFTQFFCISIVEELIFRSYIQKRLYGLIKNKYASILIGSIMFMLMHIPFQLIISNVSFGQFISTNILWLLTTAVLHIVFDFIYRKFNNIFGCIILHFLINISSMLLTI